MRRRSPALRLICDSIESLYSGRNDLERQHVSTRRQVFDPLVAVEAPGRAAVHRHRDVSAPGARDRQRARLGWFGHRRGSLDHRRRSLDDRWRRGLGNGRRWRLRSRLGRCLHGRRLGGRAHRSGRRRRGRLTGRAQLRRRWLHGGRSGAGLLVVPPAAAAGDDQGEDGCPSPPVNVVGAIGRGGGDGARRALMRVAVVGEIDLTAPLGRRGDHGRGGDRRWIAGHLRDRAGRRMAHGRRRRQAFVARPPLRAQAAQDHVEVLHQLGAARVALGDVLLQAAVDHARQLRRAVGPRGLERARLGIENLVEHVGDRLARRTAARW